MALAVALTALAVSTESSAQTKKGFINYLKPIPITCAPLSSASWGVAGVLPRDLCNGIESHKGSAVPPEFYYWDGQIIKAKDGKFHMFMSTWSGTQGFNPGWTGSEAFHAISAQSVLGPYERQDYVYSNNGSHKGHNVSALELPDGTYAVVVSETVPFTVYQSSSLDGPWKGCQASIQANGINYGSDANFASNVSLIPRHDGKFEIVQRHGLIGIADSICGPYKLQKPTWAYPTANRPSIDSIYPKRTSIPGVSNPTYAWEEDPHIWRSGGVYHVLYSGSGDRVGWHVYSTDGINNWTDDGLAFGPREYQKIFCYEGGTCSQWYKMERPGVVLQDGHPTHITWAVADVDKDNQIPANSNHGSKVIVVPFDGVAFDSDYGTTGTAGASAGGAGSGGTGAATVTSSAAGTAALGAGGRSSTGSAIALGGTASGGSTGKSPIGGGPTGGAKSSSGTAASDGGTAPSAGGSRASGNTTASGGSRTTGSTTTANTVGGGSTATGSSGLGGSVTLGSDAAKTGGSAAIGTGGSPSGGTVEVVGGSTALGSESANNENGCGCRVAGARQASTHRGLWSALGAFVLLSTRRRSTRKRAIGTRQR